MSNHGSNLRSLARAGYPGASGDMDSGDVCDGVDWMAGEIERLRVALNRVSVRMNAATVEIEHAERIAREGVTDAD